MIEKKVFDESGNLIEGTETIHWISPKDCISGGDTMLVLMKNGNVETLYYVSAKELSERIVDACKHLNDRKDNVFCRIYFRQTLGSFDLIDDDELMEFKEGHKNGIWFETINQYAYGEFIRVELKDYTDEVLLVCPDWNSLTNHLEPEN